MDKRKVIEAYRQGTLTLQECAQIIGMDSGQISRLINDPLLIGDLMPRTGKQKASG